MKKYAIHAVIYVGIKIVMGVALQHRVLSLQGQNKLFWLLFMFLIILLELPRKISALLPCGLNIFFPLIAALLYFQVPHNRCHPASHKYYKFLLTFLLLVMRLWPLGAIFGYFWWLGYRSAAFWLLWCYLWLFFEFGTYQTWHYAVMYWFSEPKEYVLLVCPTTLHVQEPVIIFLICQNPHESVCRNSHTTRTRGQNEKHGNCCEHFVRPPACLAFVLQSACTFCSWQIMLRHGYY